METKEKVIKILKAVWLTVATVLSIVFIIACIVGGVSNNKQKESVSACVENDIIAYNIDNDINKGIKKSFINPSTHAVVYDDENYITLSVDELNTYTFNNFANLLNTTTNLNWADVVLIYDGDNLIYQEYNVDDYIYFDNSDYSITFSLEQANVNFSKWIIEDSESIELTFEYSLIIDFTALQNYGDIYTLSKQAIELDIQANTQSINDGVFETLTSSTVGFIGTISSGITSIMAVFYAENSLTVIGKLSVIVVAVGLTYFLFRLIIGLVRMRG